MKSLILVNVFFCFLNFATSENNTCCFSGSFVRKKSVGSEKFLCWDPITNVTGELFLVCENVAVFPESQYKLSFNEDGNLVGRPNFNLKAPPIVISQFCFGKRRAILKNNKTVEIASVAACYEKKQPDVIDSRIKSYCMVLSVVFLALTVLVYAALPELRDLQGKSLVNLCFSLALGLGITAFMQLGSYTDMNLCAARGFFAYFFLIAAFFWMNAISIQILRGMSRPSFCQFAWKEFTWYAVYAWGSPALLTIAMAIVNYAEGDHLRPGIGHSTCWFFNKTQQWIYMYSVMTIIIIVNTGIFVYVSATMWRYSFTSNNIKALRYKFTLMLRLFIVMGLPWIFEMISSLTADHIVWAILDIFNMLAGVIIFLLLVVFRRRAVKALHRHSWLFCCSGFVERHLAKADDLEDNVVQHTAVPMDTIVET